MPRRFIILIILFFLVFSSLANPSSVIAVSCIFVASSSEIYEGQTSTVTVSITNSGSDTVVATKFLVPDVNNFEFTGGSATGWSVSLDGGNIIFSGGTMTPSQTVQFSIQVKGLLLTAEGEAWQIDGNASSDGSNFYQCGLSHGISVVPAPPSTPTPTPVPGATATPTPKPGSSSSSSSTSSTPTPTPKPVDKSAPTVSISTDFSKPFREAPKISGKASDTGVVNAGVASVDYSIDDGRNWLPVDKLESRSKNNESSKTFEFTPTIFEDGNYKVKVRAIDLTGNVGLGKTYTLVIDRLPPKTGAVFSSIGPLGLIPDENGVIYAMAGLSQKVTLSAVGGPIEMEIKSQNSKVFELTKNADNGLWSGTLNFDEAGTYTLTADSLDGAGNKTQRILPNIAVVEPGKVLLAGRSVKDAKVSLFYFDKDQKRFVLWDGASYGQNNPQRTDTNGNYRLFLPSGSYYIQVEKPGLRTFKSDIFTLTQNLPISANINLEKQQPVKIGPIVIPFIPDFTLTEKPIFFSLAKSSDGSAGKLLIEKEFPNVGLRDDLGALYSTDSLRSKPTVVVFVSSWLPNTSQQLKILEEVALSEEFNTAVIFEQETNSKVSIYKKRGGYDLPMYSDQDGELIELLNLQSLPTHVFLNRKGIITKIKVGVLNKEEITRAIND